MRIGNAAHEQQQIAIYGEIMDAALRFSNYAGKIDFSLWPFLQEMCETGILKVNAVSWKKTCARSRSLIIITIGD